MIFVKGKKKEYYKWVLFIVCIGGCFREIYILRMKVKKIVNFVNVVV